MGDFAKKSGGKIEEEDEEYLDSQNQTFQDNIKKSAQEK